MSSAAVCSNRAKDVTVLSVVHSGEYSNELHVAGIPSSLASLVIELAAQNIDSVQV